MSLWLIWEMIYWRSNERLAYSVGKRKEKISFEYNFLLNRFSYKFSLIPKSSITFFWIFVCLIDVQGPAAFVSSCLKKLCSLFMDRVQLSQGYRVILKRHFPQEFLVLIWLTSERWKAELTLEPLSSGEHGTPEFGI